MERIVGTLVALSLLGSAVCAAAEPGSQQRGKATQHPRSNHDATDLDDAESAYRAFLEIADSDDDARVTAHELEAVVQRNVAKQVSLRFGRLDRNRDGRVRPDEVPSMDAARFRRFDLDGDGSFTVVELARVMRGQASRRCEALIARLDFDSDGVLSLADLDYGAGERVARVQLAALLTSAPGVKK